MNLNTISLPWYARPIKGRSGTCVKWVLGSVSVPGPTVDRGQFPLLVPIPIFDQFPNLVPLLKKKSKFRRGSLGTQ
jgi:hypothetical protein